MNLDIFLKELVRDVVREELAAAVSPPEIRLISVKEAAKLCGVGRQVIDELVKDAESGFPAVRLGQRSTMIDHGRLVVWIRNGGLKGLVSDGGNVTEFRRAG